jgi:hypothetical protein
MIHSNSEFTERHNIWEYQFNIIQFWIELPSVFEIRVIIGSSYLNEALLKHHKQYNYLFGRQYVCTLDISMDNTLFMQIN